MKNLSEQYRVQAGVALMSFRGAPAASCAVHLLPEYILPLSAVGTSVAIGHLATGNTSHFFFRFNNFSNVGRISYQYDNEICHLQN